MARYKIAAVSLIVLAGVAGKLFPGLDADLLIVAIVVGFGLLLYGFFRGSK